MSNPSKNLSNGCSCPPECNCPCCTGPYFTITGVEKAGTFVTLAEPIKIKV